MAFNKKKTTSKEKQHKFIERIISRNSKIWIDITPQYVQVIRLKGHLTKYQVRLSQVIFVFLLLSLVWFVMTCTNWALCDNFCEIITSRSADRDAILTNTICTTLYSSAATLPITLEYEQHFLPRQ